MSGFCPSHNTAHLFSLCLYCMSLVLYVSLLFYAFHSLPLAVPCSLRLSGSLPPSPLLSLPYLIEEQKRYKFRPLPCHHRYRVDYLSLGLIMGYLHGGMGQPGGPCCQGTCQQPVSSSLSPRNVTSSEPPYPSRCPRGAVPVSFSGPGPELRHPLAQTGGFFPITYFLPPYFFPCSLSCSELPLSGEVRKREEIEKT